MAGGADGSAAGEQSPGANPDGGKGELRGPPGHPKRPSGHFSINAGPDLELHKQVRGILNKMTSQSATQRENAPDPWEAEALRAFERGEAEVSSIEMIGGVPYMRFMRPLFMEESCLECHRAEGFREGDVRGGISVSIPIQPLQAVVRKHTTTVGLGHGLLWILGLVGIGSRARQLVKGARERWHTEQSLRKSRDFLQAVVDAFPETLTVINLDYTIALANRPVLEAWPENDGGSDRITCHKALHRRDTPCDGTEAPCPLKETVRTGARMSATHTHFDDCGNERVIELIAVPIFDKSGKLVQVIESGRDVTERVKAERKRRELEAELQRHAERQRELLKQLIAVQEEERRRVARELHDDLGQDLAGLVVNLQGIERLWADQPEQACLELGRLRTCVAEMTDRMYDMIVTLRPSVLDDLGLIPALRSHAQRVLGNAGIRLAFDARDLTHRLSPEIETALFRTFQEALSNVVRHARASQVRLSLTARDGVFEGEITDDGCGFDPEAVQASGNGRQGLGLLGMRERMALCDGTLEIISRPGAGTRVRIWMPLPEVSRG